MRDAKDEERARAWAESFLCGMRSPVASDMDALKGAGVTAWLAHAFEEGRREGDGEMAAAPADVHERGWQWRPVGTDTAFAPPFGAIRACRVCGCLVAGGPTACARCAAATPEASAAGGFYEWNKDATAFLKEAVGDPPTPGPSVAPPAADRDPELSALPRPCPSPGLLGPQCPAVAPCVYDDANAAWVNRYMANHKSESTSLDALIRETARTAFSAGRGYESMLTATPEPSAAPPAAERDAELSALRRVAEAARAADDAYSGRGVWGPSRVRGAMVALRDALAAYDAAKGGGR